VTYHYEDAIRDVLVDVSATFDSGVLYAIAGNSDSGKSALLSLIAGFETVAEGHIYYEGADLNDLDLDRYRSKHVGVIFQNYNLLMNRTAVENVTKAMNISGVRVHDEKKYALQLLAKVGIDERTATKPVQCLSDAEQQRVGIARALSYDPEIVIAHEPTGNLDRHDTDAILDIFKSLAHEEGKCVILVTSSKRIEKEVDVVFKMEEGELVA
jgi:putative ABC transport system ATP-binding protein